ncbi:hypothetical protein GDO81_027403 [Engystomops pustulosus]|uniref:MADF domain-containing protein n=1 Tax=Engystomops pustulosus TaxID=76066 RepID=A0AAV6YZB9_ENGPU|nr:hypothetical protein GDO81_027403 [Engystomops pustulosus]
MSPDEQNLACKDVQQRWRSCRDQYKKDLRAQEGQSGSGRSRKRPYCFREQMRFLADIFTIGPTEDNLEAEAEDTDINPPVVAASDVATDDLETAAAAEDATAGPTSDNPEQLQVGEAQSPSPVPRGRRARRAPPGRVIDENVLNYLGRRAQEDTIVTYLRSLADHMRRVPQEHLLRCQGAFSIILEACCPPNNPTPVFEALEQWRLYGHIVPRPQPLPPPPPPPPQAPPSFYSGTYPASELHHSQSHMFYAAGGHNQPQGHPQYASASHIYQGRPSAGLAPPPSPAPHFQAQRGERQDSPAQHFLNL